MGLGDATAGVASQPGAALLRPDVLLVELTSLEQLSFPTSSSARVKYVSVCASPRHLAVGASSGSVYLFSRFASKYRQGGGVPVQLITTSDGAATMLQMSPDERHLAIASARGTVHVAALNDGVLASNGSGAAPALCRTNSLHHGAQVTALAWSPCGTVLFVGDHRGTVTRTQVMHTRLFRSASEQLLETSGSVVQLDARQDLLLVSTTARCFIYDLERHTTSPVGRKTRQGVYGACFVDNLGSSSGQRSTIFAARPSGRLWEVDCTGAVYSTHQFGSVAALPVAPLLTYRYQVNAEELSAERGSLPVPFGQLHAMRTGHGDAALLSVSDDTLHLVEPTHARLVLVCVADQPIEQYSVCNGDVFLLSAEGGLRKFSLLGVRQAVEQLYAKQHLAQAANLVAWYAPAAATSVCWSFELLSALCNFVAERRDPSTDAMLATLRQMARAAADTCTRLKLDMHRQQFDAKHPAGVAVRRSAGSSESRVPRRCKRARSVTAAVRRGRRRGRGRLICADATSMQCGSDCEKAHLSDSVLDSLPSVRCSDTCAEEPFDWRQGGAAWNAQRQVLPAPDDQQSLRTLLAGPRGAPPLMQLHAENGVLTQVDEPSPVNNRFERSLFDLGITTPISAIDVATLLSNTTAALPPWATAGRPVTPPSAPLLLYDALEQSNWAADEGRAHLPPMPPVPLVVRGRRHARKTAHTAGNREAADSGDSQSPSSGRGTPVSVDEMNNSLGSPAASTDAYTRAMRILRRKAARPGTGAKQRGSELADGGAQQLGTRQPTGRPSARAPAVAPPPPPALDHCGQCRLHRSWPLTLQLCALVRRVPARAELYSLGGVPATEEQWVDFLTKQRDQMSAAASGGERRGNACPCLACERLLHASPHTDLLPAPRGYVHPLPSDGKATSAEVLISGLLNELDERDMIAVFGTLHAKTGAGAEKAAQPPADPPGDATAASAAAAAQPHSSACSSHPCDSCELAYSTYCNPAYASSHEGDTLSSVSATAALDTALQVPVWCAARACAAVMGCEHLLRLVESGLAPQWAASPEFWRTAATLALEQSRIQHGQLLPPKLLGTLVTDLCDRRVLAASDDLVSQLAALQSDDETSQPRRLPPAGFTLDASGPCAQCGLPLNKPLQAERPDLTDATDDVESHVMLFPLCGHASHAHCLQEPVGADGHSSCPKCTTSV